jgi:DGQHR domain-containing protein
MTEPESIQKISVIVPKNPFVPSSLRDVQRCLAALDVVKLMEWWPGKPHVPHRDAQRVRNIQRSLDWKRVAQIAAYLLQREIVNPANLIDKYFGEIYEPKKLEPGRQWPPKVPRVVGFERSEYPTFSNVLLHVNGARIEPLESEGSPDHRLDEAATLIFDENDKDLYFSVIDGQHRINGAYFAVQILREDDPGIEWQIPSEIFLNLDKPGATPRHQAQIFIDVNFNQKKVDRSLVADLFPTARGKRGPLDEKERAQDIGRRLMLDVGPLKGMIQIPGIKYGVADVITLATLNSAIEDILEVLETANISSLDEQSEFLAQCLDAWLEASGRRHDIAASDKLDPENVAYQGRVLVSVIALIPACIWILKKKHIDPVSDKAFDALAAWFKRLIEHAGLQKNGKFIPKGEFGTKGFLGSGGIGRFRETLWAAALSDRKITGRSTAGKSKLADDHKTRVLSELQHDSR